MKISCQSCQAKYTIADEKVLGKIVKIRCKKCGATIVINGNETGAGASGTTGNSTAEAQAYDYAGGVSSGDQWTVNVADGDQRTMTADEIAAAFKTGTVTDETYAWKDGMADWLPIREIAELHAAIEGGGDAGLSPDATHQDPTAASLSAPPIQEEPTRVGYTGYGGAAAAASAATNGNGAALFGGLTPEPAAAAARRPGGRAGGGMDLFGGVSHAGGEDDVMTSAPAGMPQVSDEPGKLTGQRNENSVLFSLSALTSNAPKADAPVAGTEGSGLIDIRALSASMSDKDAGKKNHADDIMNLGGGGAFSAALAAPVLAPPMMDGGGGLMDTGAPQKDNTKLILASIIGAGALIALAIVLVFVLKKPEAPPVPTATTMPTDTAGTASSAPAPGAATVATNDTPPAADTAAAAGGGPAAPGTGQAASPAAPGHAGGSGGGGHKATGGGGGGDTTPKFTPPAAPAAPAAGGGGGGSLDDALRNSVGGPKSAPAAAAQAASTSPFDRGAAAAALSSINVASCRKGDGPTGSGHIKVTFAPNGSVASAVVDQPPFAGTAVGGCVAGKFRSAHIPPFAGGPVPVGKSFVVE